MERIGCWRVDRRRFPASPSQNGVTPLIGSIAKVLDWSHHEGRVHVQGETWRAQSKVFLKPGQQVRISAIEGLTLLVEPIETIKGEEGHGH